MDKSQTLKSNKGSKKVVDLIVLDKFKTKDELKNEYLARINTWVEWMNKRLDRVATDNISQEEQDEYFVINNFLRNFLLKRLSWVLESVDDPELQYKYLLVLPPFNHQGNIKAFVLHFFRFIDEDNKNNLEYLSLDKSEKEIRILWDIYKLTKTIETIEVLQKSIAGDNPFPSRFSEGHIKKTLETISELLNLLIQICVKPNHFQDIRYNFPPGVFAPEAILNRKENESYLINEITLNKFDYRNYFFHVYFKPSMKAFYKEKDLTFKYNYLDFEIMRQEFLLHWLNTRLKNSPKKQEVFQGYKLGQQKFSEVIERNPSMELTLLRKLPGNVFNDLIAEVNESVDEKERVSVDLMSQKSGSFAKQMDLFKNAKSIARKTTEAIKGILGKLTETTEKSKGKKGSKKELSFDPGDASYQIKILKESEIDFPYLSEEEEDYNKIYDNILQGIEIEQYEAFDEKVGKIHTSYGESNLFTRQEPKNEVALPCLIKEKMKFGVAMHLLILGIEVKEEADAEGRKGYQMKPFFVYGSKARNFEMGDPQGQRDVMGKPFFIYDSAYGIVVKKAMYMTEMVLNNLP